MAGVTLERTRAVGIITFGYVLLLSSAFERATTSCSLRYVLPLATPTCTETDMDTLSYSL